jgi:serine/threonine protein phosphatase PrpC
VAEPQSPATDPKPVERPHIMRFAAQSDVGKIRSKNDDSAYAGRHLAVVADGMGGHAGGDVASAATVLDMIHLDRGDYEGDAGTTLADEIQTANSLLSELVHINPKLAGMGTTVTALLLAEGKLHFAHIGDSRAYRLRGGRLEQLSRDHSLLQEQIDAGLLTPEEAVYSMNRNLVTRAVGVEPQVELEVVGHELRSGDTVLLCSDGLSDMLPDAAIAQVMRANDSLELTGQALIAAANAAGGRDNISVVLVRAKGGAAQTGRAWWPFRRS